MSRAISLLLAPAAAKSPTDSSRSVSRALSSCAGSERSAGRWTSLCNCRRMLRTHPGEAKLSAFPAAAGASNKEIARDMGVSVRTVEGHLYQVYAKLQVTSRVELAPLLRQDAQ